jgi:tRNA(fMet)-specific endonuclease VapC
LRCFFRYGCVRSDFARGEPNTLGCVKVAAPEHVATSIVTVMEVEFGLALDPRRAPQFAPGTYAPFEAVTVLPYEAAIALGLSVFIRAGMIPSRA